MPHEQSATDDTPPQDTTLETQDTAGQTADARAHERVEERELWYDEPVEQELPRRPRRRRLLGTGGNPIALALLGTLLIACGFIGGVLVEKGQGSSSAATASGGLASRFAALRSAVAGGTAGGRGASAGAGASSSFGGAGAAGGGAGATIGQVAYVSGHTLYVTDPEGNTVKVTTSAASTVTKTVKADVKGIHPGETVIVTGSASAHGAVSAETIRVSEAGGGLGALFGAGGGSGGGGGRRGGSGEPALFGG